MPRVYSGTFIEIARLIQSRTVTDQFVVLTKGNAQLGMVKWYAPWRKYCFFPAKETLFEEVCMREIAGFCETETKSWKEKRKNSNG